MNKEQKMKKNYRFIRRNVTVVEQLRKCSVDWKEAGIACLGSGGVIVQPDPIFRLYEIGQEIIIERWCRYGDTCR